MTLTVSPEHLVAWMRVFRDRILVEKDVLTELDAAVGDADHGSNMVRGVNAVVDRLEADPPQTIADFGRTVGMTLVATVGGAAGPLYGTFFLRAAAAAGELETLDSETLRDVFAAGVRGVHARGKAELGDKTLYDVMHAAVSAVADGGDRPLSEGARLAAAAARAEMERLRDQPARRGRASYLGERSAGHVDPGSASSVMLFESLAEALNAVTDG